jgi:alkanesulfonate monooxygenase SsuD/methylene tetrahydromethanopterin reductase-like flavin-dependent oxidoreductase (luciferase family)
LPSVCPHDQRITTDDPYNRPDKGADTFGAGYFASAWMTDHLQDGTDDMLESFASISYLAALHSRLKFGQTVVCQSFRNF